MSDKKIPMYLETREDYEYMRNNFPYDVWSKDFTALLSISIHETCIAKCKVSVNEEGYVNKITDIDWFSQKTKNDIKRMKERDEYLENYSYTRMKVAENVDLKFGECSVREYDIDGKKVYYIFRIQEVENSKASKLGYTIDELYELLLGIGEAETELRETEEKLKEMKDNVKKKIMEENNLTEEEYNRLEEDSDGE